MNKAATHVWHWPSLPDRNGQKCRVALANDGTGRVRVTFEDGQEALAVRFAVRRIPRKSL